MSISINISIRDAIALLTGGEASNDVCENIINALEKKCVDDAAKIASAVSTSSTTMNSIIANNEEVDFTIESIPTENRIRVIQVIRKNLGWGLKESKDFCDIVTGPWNQNTNNFDIGSPNTMRINKNNVSILNNDLINLGCKTYVWPS